MADDAARAMRELDAEGLRIAEKAFRQGCAEVERLAKQTSMVPIGWYPRTKKSGKKGGKTGGELKRSLRVTVIGLQGLRLMARCESDLAYARPQHERVFHHPGLYTKSKAGPAYRAAYFERAAEMVFGSGVDPLGLSSAAHKTFDQLLKAAGG